MMFAVASICESDSHVLKFVLGRVGMINDGIMQVAAGQGNGWWILSFLLAIDQAVDISQAMLIALIWHGHTPVNTFYSLHSAGCNFKVNEAGFSAAISHHRCILAQAEHLLTQYSGIRITKAVFVAATSNH